VTDLPMDVLGRVARLIGDRWSMLVVAALAGGGRRYGELVDAIDGISSNVLAARLGALADAGLIVGEPYSSRQDRLRYELTAEGRALVDALAGLAAWGAANVDTDDDPALRHGDCGGPLQARWYCPTCDVEVEPGEAGQVFLA
jgi:DNA-binding HxlR family transcriptional regulator